MEIVEVKWDDAWIDTDDYLKKDSEKLKPIR